MRTLRSKAALLAVAGSALIGAGVGVGTYAAVGGPGSTVTKVVQTPAPSASTASTAPQTSSALTTATSTSIGTVYTRTSPGVVKITVTSQGSFSFGGRDTQQAQGSGFVYDRQGHIVTDQHVVDGADSISVTFPNGATYRATVVGSDASTDLAVIKVSAPSSLLRPLTLGDSSAVKVGDPVVAIGSPFGLQNTVTSGIVSALHRDITAPNGFTINDSIQTDAPINHGNSGGVLLNMSGQVIGVTAQIDSESGGSDGVGFAIPANTVRSVASQLIGTGNVAHAYLGVRIQTLPADAAAALHVPVGVEVTQVIGGSPADKAGLRAATSSTVVNGTAYAVGGDVITRVDGRRVTTADGLTSAVGAYKPGDSISVTFVRNGTTKTVHVVLSKRPS
ncbi:MAG TPA: trypsin-like peptidase domain-containing protein [Gaiellaceae bacterium]|nr:trypsin-like peptidase domain-containing protein [Gaiellaceae bacterium]